MTTPAVPGNGNKKNISPVENQKEIESNEKAAEGISIVQGQRSLANETKNENIKHHSLHN